MKFPHLLGRVTVAIGIVLGSLAAQATEFRSSDIHPDDYPTVLAVRHMGEALSKATGGATPASRASSQRTALTHQR